MSSNLGRVSRVYLVKYIFRYCVLLGVILASFSTDAAKPLIPLIISSGLCKCYNRFSVNTNMCPGVYGTASLPGVAIGTNTLP